MSQKGIINRLRSLEEIQDISVTVSGPSDGTIRVEHAKHHGPEFIFIWSPDHYIGYFVDSAGARSQAIVSLYTPLAAIHFVSAYLALDNIRANQKG